MEIAVTEMLGLRRIYAASGATPFGPDCNKWPAKWYDMVRIAEIEEMRIDSEIEKVKGLI